MMGKTALKTFGFVLALGVWLLAGLAHAAGSPPGERMTATVVEFSVRGDLPDHAGAIMADLMVSAIANTGSFTLKDRLSLAVAARIAKAQELGATGLLDPKTAAELGRLYGVDAIVTGGISKLGDLITVQARLFDTKTAALLRSGQIQGRDLDTLQIKIHELAAMITAPPEPPKTYALTVRTEPVDAGVRLLSSPTPYQPGVRLAPGEYEVEVTREDYKARRESVRIEDRDVTVTLALEPARFGLTIRPQPEDAEIRLLDSAVIYQPGVALAPGDYEVEVSREGYVSRKFPVKIVDSEIVAPVVLERVPPPPQYRLTVRVDPPEARVRLLGIRTAYQPGVQLEPGSYTVEVSQTGYETVQVPVRIVDSDVTVPVTLARTPEPSQFRLTVRADPPDAQIRILNIRPAYRPGIQLEPGSYTIEVSKSGYETARVTARIVDGDVTVPVTLTRTPEPSQFRLTVRADPADARVRLLGVRTTYQPGVRLPPGNYTVEVSKAGYETARVTARIVDSDVTVPVTLARTPEPSQFRLTVRADPADARVRLVDSPFAYQPGVQLPPGSYVVEVTRSGYEPKRVTVRIADRDVTERVTLERIAVAEPPSRPGEWRIGSLRIEGSMANQDRAEIQRVFGGYVGRTVTRDTLLDGAMQVYRTTGITLGFVVRTNPSGAAELQARVARRVRQTYESSIPILTRGQLERSGFAVSVQ